MIDAAMKPVILSLYATSITGWALCLAPHLPRLATQWAYEQIRQDKPQCSKRSPGPIPSTGGSPNTSASATNSNYSKPTGRSA